MIYVAMCLFVSVLVIVFLIGGLVNFSSKIADQRNSITNLETSTKQWMGTAEGFKKIGEKHADDLSVAYNKLIDSAEETDSLKEALGKERSRNKSVEVHTGLIMEKMAPFFEMFNHDPKNAHHLGNPIDYIIFNEEEIVFLEVKTGKARTTKKQNNIKKLIEAGKVKWELVRFDYE
ncbi:MAG: hypothetical protein KAS32_11750 [Candidatus Peribacteraceae bacterium]|nr:hypothetical protein [Candidatus Peribacteraceae bacterium]